MDEGKKLVICSKKPLITETANKNYAVELVEELAPSSRIAELEKENAELRKERDLWLAYCSDQRDLIQEATEHINDARTMIVTLQATIDRISDDTP